MYGLPVEAGVNISSNISSDILPEASDSIPETLGNVIGGAALDPFVRAKKAYDVYSKTGDPLLAAEKVAPRVARGIIKNLRISEDGTLRSANNEILLENVTPVERAMIAAGFTPSRLALENERANSKRLLAERSAGASEGYNNRIARAIMSGDSDSLNKTIDEVIKHNETAPLEEYVDISNQAIERYLEQWIVKNSPAGVSKKQLPALLDINSRIDKASASR